MVLFSSHMMPNPWAEIRDRLEIRTFCWLQPRAARYTESITYSRKDFNHGVFAASPTSWCSEDIFCIQSELLVLYTNIWRAYTLRSVISGQGMDNQFFQWEIKDNSSLASRVFIHEYLLTVLFGLSESDEWLNRDLYHVLGNADWKWWISDYIEHG